MLKINLAPQSLKDKFRMERISKSITIIISLLGFYFALSIIVMFLANFYMQMHLEQTLNIAKSVTKSTESYTNEINEINNTTNHISGMQDDFIQWSKLLYSIGKSANKDVKFSSIRIDKKNDSVTMEIFAKTRDGLLEFKKNIEANEYLSEINFPIKTLFEKENIEFSINAKISSYEFNEL